MKRLLAHLILKVTGWRWVRRVFTKRRWGRRVAMRFVAGETLDEAVAVAVDLNRQGFSASLDHLGEHVGDPALAGAARDHYLRCLDRIDADGLDANISIKLTQLGLGLDNDLARRSLDDLADRAASLGLTITVDMEESQYTAATVSAYFAAQQTHGNLGIALQSYLRRTRDDLLSVLPHGGHVRLCKGAYDESAGVAFESGDEVNRSYDELLELLMREPGVRPAIASHDEGRIERAAALADSRSEPFEFQMLFGVRTALQQSLRDRGYAVRVYVPYGNAWYPYLTRRIAERPSNTRFFIRALFGR